DFAVTAQAGDLLVLGTGRVDPVDQLPVAVHARILGDPAVVVADLDVLRVVTGRELQRVPEPVLRLVHVLVDDVVMRRVAVVAARDLAMAASAPGHVLLVHGVALGARGRVGAEVGGPVRVAEGEQPKAEGRAEDKDETRVDDDWHAHPTQRGAPAGLWPGLHRDASLCRPLSGATVSAHRRSDSFITQKAGRSLVPEGTGCADFAGGRRYRPAQVVRG